MMQNLYLFMAYRLIIIKVSYKMELSEIISYFSFNHFVKIRNYLNRTKGRENIIKVVFLTRTYFLKKKSNMFLLNYNVLIIYFA